MINLKSIFPKRSKYANYSKSHLIDTIDRNSKIMRAQEHIIKGQGILLENLEKQIQESKAMRDLILSNSELFQTLLLKLTKLSKSEEEE